MTLSRDKVRLGNRMVQNIEHCISTRLSRVGVSALVLCAVPAPSRLFFQKVAVMEYIRICDWEKFQHYKKRNPPWIKLHISLLDNEAFECLHNDSKVLLVCLWLFAARKGNGEIPSNLSYLQRKLPLHKKVKLQPLIDAGFIECYQDDSKMPHNETKYLCAETETETEAEQRQRQRFVPPTLSELQAYIKEKSHNVDAVKFLEWYTEADWKDRDGKPVKNWKLKVISWSNRDDRRTQNNRAQSAQTRRESFAEQESNYGQTIK